MFKRAAAHGNRARLVTHQAELSAVGTGLVVSQLGGLLSGASLQGAGHEATEGRDGHLFHGGQIDVGGGPLFSKGLFTDDFAPTSRLFADSGEVFRGEGSLRHALSLLEVTAKAVE
jgi:hypothetical protein